MNAAFRQSFWKPPPGLNATSGLTMMTRYLKNSISYHICLMSFKNVAVGWHATSKFLDVAVFPHNAIALMPRRWSSLEF